MANSANSSEKSTQQPAPDNPNAVNSDLPDSKPSSIPSLNPNPNITNSQSQSTPPPLQLIQPSQVSTFTPSFRPPVPLPSVTPQFPPIPNPSFQNHAIQVQPPGVMMPTQYGQPGQIPGQMPGQQGMRMYAPIPNGYQMAGAQGTMNPPGIK